MAPPSTETAIATVDGVTTPGGATASQLRALNAIAGRQERDLANLLDERFGVRDVAELTITEASSLIQELNGASNGHSRGGHG